ncbi:MAG: hypothetical protein AB1497_11235 [Bacillota bacterium]
MDTVDIIPFDPNVAPAGPLQDRSVLEDVIVEFDPVTHVLAQKIARLIDVITGGIAGDPPP